MERRTHSVTSGARPPLVHQQDLAPPAKKLKTQPPVPTPAESTPSSATQSPQRTTLFIDNDKQIPALLTRLQQLSTTVALVMSPDDMNQDGLRKNLMVNHDGSTRESPGRLFVSEGNQPLTLVLDFRHFEPRQLGSLNSLFDDPPTLDGQLLGSHVSIIALVNDQLFPDHISQTYKPGNDFSRRVAPGFRQGSLWHETLNAQSDKGHCMTDVLHQKVPDFTTAAEGTSGRTVRTIDLAGKNWREVLFGRACINEKGQRCYLPGQLARALPGEMLVLKAAPWKDPAFAYALYKLIHSGSYYANGEDHRLPDNISWARQPLTPEDISLLKQGVKWVSEPGPGMAVINGDTLALVTRQSKFDPQGSLTGHDTFTHWFAGCEGIRVTSPLDTNQWFELLQAVQKLGKPAPVSVYLDTPAQQPLPFKGPEQTDSEEFFATVVSPQSGPLTGNGHVTLTRGDDAFLRQGNAARGQLMDTGAVSCEPLNIVITPELRLSSLVEDLRLVSLKKAEFQRREQPFIQALREGRKLRIRGLENNTTLARQLESLLLSPPSLIVNGERETFPRAQIDVIWPEGAKTDSVLWQQAQDLGGLSSSGQTLEELKAWLQDEFGLSENDSDIVDTVARLQDITSRLAPPAQQFQLGTDLLTKLVIQARLEQKLTSADTLEPAHWNKAINSVLLKTYRSNPDLYNLLRLAVRSQLQDHRCDWVDQLALKRWLQAHPNPDAACIQKHFWSLTRYVSHTAISQLPDHIRACASPSLEVDPQSTAFKLMASQVRQAAGHNNQDDTVIFLHRHLCLEKQLLDICYELGQHKRREEIEQMGQLIGTVIQSRQSQAVKQKTIEHYLTLFQFAPHNCALIARALVNPDDPGNWKHWYKRRETRLLEKVKEHPVTLISGEPGAGKSFMAATVAKTLQGGGRAQTLCCGPMTRLSDLMVKESLVTDPLTGDAGVKREDGPLLQWAKRNATAQHPAVLVIDEANLVDPALWNCLKGLYETPASISDQQGHPWPVSEHHRIIMTGNPTSMTGRHLNAFLKDRAPELYYRPFNDNFMASQIVDPVLQTVVEQVAHQCPGVSKPGVSKPGVSKTEQLQLTNRLSLATISLFNQYRHLILEHEFSPRDLTDFCERLLRYLDSARQKGLATCLQQHRPPEQEKALTGLIWQAMVDTLGGLVPTSHRWQLDSLQTWYQVTYGADTALVEPHQVRFDYFFDRWQARSGIGPDAFNLDNASVKALSRQVWLELDRLQARRHNPQDQSKGRCATVIEGPAGRGKDDLLKRLIQEWNRQQREDGQAPVRCHAISLNPNHPDAFYKTLQQASQAGEIMLGSEMNLLKSQYHEGQMNDLLTGASTPGFHLFATVNPATFAGRHPLSSALQSRCSLVTLGDYSHEDLDKIAATLFPDPALADKVAQWHWQLLEQLRANEIPQHPSVADMKKLAACCGFPLILDRMNQMSITPESQAPSTVSASTVSASTVSASTMKMELETRGEQQTRARQETELKKQFEQQYGFYLHFLARKAGTESLSLDEVLAAPVSQTSDRQTPMRNYSVWTDWIHTRLPGLLTRPISVVAGIENSYDATGGIVTLKKECLAADPVQDASIKHEIVRLLAHDQWQRHLPLVSPYPDDILFSAAYHFWQQKSFERHYADYPEWSQYAKQIFPLSEEEQASLKLSSNADYLEALASLAAQQPSAEGLAQFEKALLGSRQDAVRHDKPTRSLNPARSSQPCEPAVVDAHTTIQRELEDIAQATVYIDGSQLPARAKQAVFPWKKLKPDVINVTRYFDKTNLHKTRMSVSQAVLEGEHIYTKNVALGSMGYEVIKPTAGISSTMTLEDDSGAFTVTIGPEEAVNWNPVPGLAPHQKILALTACPPVALEVLRDRATHQHFIRPVNPEFQGTLDIQIAIRKLAPKNRGSSRHARQALAPAADSALCEALRPLFEQDGGPLFQAFQKTSKLSTAQQQCEQLQELCRRFTAVPDQLTPPGGQFGVAHLQHLFRHKYGQCDHRALCFHVMATWLAIPSRIVKGEAYTQVEASWDGGYSWHVYDLGSAVHPDQISLEQPTPYVKIARGLVISEPCRLQMLKVARKNRALLEQALQVSPGKLDAWVRAGGNRPVPCGTMPDQFDREHCPEAQCAVKAKAKVCEGLLRLLFPLEGTNTPDADIIDLLLLLIPADNEECLQGHTARFFSRLMLKFKSLANRGGRYPTQALCQMLTTMVATAAGGPSWQACQDTLYDDVLCNLGWDSKHCWREADRDLAAFLLLDNDWIPTSKPCALASLHKLAQSEVYGERARRKLDAWYEGLNQKIAPSLLPSVTPKGIAAQLPAALARAGRSRALESRLRAGGGVQDAYSWAASDHLDADRLIRQQAFFRERTESVSLPPIVMVGLLQQDAPEYEALLHKFNVPLTETGVVDTARQGQTDSVPSPRQQRRALVTLMRRWTSDPVDIDEMVNTPDFDRQRIMKKLNYLYDIPPDQEEAFAQAIEAYREEFVLPQVRLSARSAPLMDVIREQFFEYLYSVTGAGRGKVQVLYSQSGPQIPGKGSRDPEGFFQPNTPSQWHALHQRLCNDKKSGDQEPGNTLHISPQLLQRNGRFDQAVVIGAEEMHGYWKEFLASLDLTDAAKYCLTVGKRS
ncbi:MAG: AAA family ATPase [Kistimonas sp.]|nr:AAA family ATPase [Kistimonas sp.]